jgi:hypothetical protein
MMTERRNCCLHQPFFELCNMGMLSSKVPSMLIYRKYRTGQLMEILVRTHLLRIPAVNYVAFRKSWSLDARLPGILAGNSRAFVKVGACTFVVNYGPKPLGTL